MQNTPVEKKPFLIGIAGGSGSGKTTLARMLLESFKKENASLIEVDSFYRSNDHITFSQREKINYDHPESLELNLLAEKLKDLKAGIEVLIPCYDFALHTRSSETARIAPTPIIIVEGILTFANSELCELFNFKIFVETPESVRLERRIARDTAERGRTRESVITQWNATVLPMHNLYCEPTKDRCTRLISGESELRALAEELSVLQFSVD